MNINEKLAGMTRAEVQKYWDDMRIRDTVKSHKIKTAHLVKRKAKQGIQKAITARDKIKAQKHVTGNEWITGEMLYNRLVELGVKYDPDTGEVYREKDNILNGGTYRSLVGRLKEGSEYRWFTVDGHAYRTGVLAWVLLHKTLVLAGGRGDAEIGKYLVHLNGNGQDCRERNLSVEKSRDAIYDDKREALRERRERIQAEKDMYGMRNKDIVLSGKSGKWLVYLDVFGKRELLDEANSFEEAERKWNDRRVEFNEARKMME